MDIDKELIILAGPPTVDKYYGDIKSELRDFHIAYAKQIAEHDDVLVLVAERDRIIDEADAHSPRMAHLDAEIEKLGREAVGGKIIIKHILWLAQFQIEGIVQPVQCHTEVAQKLYSDMEVRDRSACNDWEIL